MEKENAFMVFLIRLLSVIRCSKFDSINGTTSQIFPKIPIFTEALHAKLCIQFCVINLKQFVINALKICNNCSILCKFELKKLFAKDFTIEHDTNIASYSRNDEG